MQPYQRSRREALIAGALWLIFAIWVTTVSYQLGYLHNDRSTMLGVPSWVFWGVLVPWVAAVVANSIYAFFILADDE